MLALPIPPTHYVWLVCNDPVSYDSSYGWAEGPSADTLSSWLQATPVNVRALLKELHTWWPTNKLYVSEIGFAEPFENEWTDMYRMKRGANGSVASPGPQLVLVIEVKQ
ncbi:uncharacterized protein EV420DRAFT_1067563 [Desarmillaria tabescens]|uniref:Uncharacterized protein n=1 Tax=Armillaria tabescens TaxID=1929756 RepID=A0AA39MR33_ARMTA|nr:uncharacterized protein EV420DRAFT_1067563 [Desarmillaria tabescens]KAK0443133.1 hypothetical protein EV420DRAFT_1067563 [Desarmillaria tabescens]